MNDLLAGLLSALVATNAPLAVSNLVHQKTGLALAVTDRNDPVEKRYQAVLLEDDAAVAEFTRWREAHAQLGSTSRDGVDVALLNNRIRQRAAPVRSAYEAFLAEHPRHANARIAFAAFLEEIGEDEESGRQLERAVEFNPDSPVALNNLANHYGHSGEVTNAFTLYERAIRLSPAEPLYCENLATTVFLFRRDAMAHYRITEPDVFAKALGLYRQALDLDPTFDRAVELAKSYYGVRLTAIEDPERRRQAERKLAEDALAAWRHAQTLAANETDREGVRLHFARWQIQLGRTDEARRELQAVTNATFATGKGTLLKKLEASQAAQAPTADAPAPSGPTPAPPLIPPGNP